MSTISLRRLILLPGALLIALSFLIAPSSSLAHETPRGW